MSAERREVILRHWIRHNGWIASLHENYVYHVHMMADEIGGTIRKPKYSPDECMKYGITYEYSIMINEDTENPICICTIPAMTEEGYFIMQGSEKVVLIQEARLKSEILTHIDRQGSKNENKEIISYYEENKNTDIGIESKYVPSCSSPCCELFVNGAHVPIRIRLVDDSVIELDTFLIHNNMRGIRSVGIWEVITHLFALDIVDMSVLLRSYCKRFDDEQTYNVCMTYIIASTRGTGALSVENDRETIRYKMFGGTEDDQCVVATLLTMIVACVRAKLDESQVSDRDDYQLKRLKTPGETVYGMFKYCISKCKKASSLKNSIENYVHTFIKRGDITIGGRSYNKMSIQLSRRSDIDVLSSVRKVMVPCDENSTKIEMRQIHHSQMGFICPCETPEGKTVGIMKSLALTCLISTKTDMNAWAKKICTERPLGKQHRVSEYGLAWVIVDGAVVGWCKEPDYSDTSSKFVYDLKCKYPTVSVTLNGNIIKIRAEGGRPIRPLVVVKDHPVDWNSAIDIQYLDPVECKPENSNIADMGYNGNWKAFTHMEIHPCAMLGLAASLVPFPEHNQSARNVFSSAMIKQAMQMYGSEKTCDTLQRPLVQTIVGRAVGYDESPNGINLVTCLMSLNGFNQEDAIIIKKSSVERGIFASTARYSTTVTVDNPWHIIELGHIPQTFGNVSETEAIHALGQFSLGHQGVRVPAFLENVSSLQQFAVLHGGTERTMTEVAPLLSSKNPKIIQTKYTIDEKSGKTKLKLVMSAHQTLQQGDKLSSRHAQKGVVGLLMNDEDMPFTSRDGIIPDIIINPHAIPSRMTVGQLIEGVLGKSAAINGTFEDGTPFIRSGKKELEDIMNMRDTERMILGTTGEMIQTPIAVGIVYYMALKHQAADKIYVRSKNVSSISTRKSIMSRQPISGRSKGGGLRLGEMEYDCFIAHGASKLVTEVSENSDMVDVPYCNTCKIVTDIFNDVCRLCKTTKTVTKRVPFSYVILKDMMLAANINLQTEM